MLCKSLIQFSVDGQGCVPSLLFDLRPNYSGGNEDNGDLLQKNGAVTPQETDPDLPVSVRDSPAEAWVGGGLLQAWGH